MAGGKKRAVQSRHSTSTSSLNTSAASSSTAHGNIQLGGTSSSSDSDLLTALTKEQLKVECRRRGQKTTGNKMELLQRLGHRMTQNNVNVVHSSPSSTSSRRKDVTTANGDNRLSRTPSSTPRQLVAQRERERCERENIVLWKQPLTTIHYCSKEIFVLMQTYGLKLANYRKTSTAVIIFVCLLGLYLSSGGTWGAATVSWACYWVGLGILSSVGLGTGLHTFLLYLGPHIARVTIAAYECGALNFPEPPYPDEIICPDKPDYAHYGASIWNIMTKVRVEAMLWGAGTALGELPPYFMARASRLSGYDPDDELDLREFEELQRKKHEDPCNMSLLDRTKLCVERLVERVGFFGILACASIPNPLFDLAGITCGHFLVPFWTFFGATLIGKAVIKMHIQKMFVIIAFNDKLLQNAVSYIATVPFIGTKLQEPFKEFLNKQKSKLHKKSGPAMPDEESSLLACIFEKFVIGMIIYFLISIVNSLAQSHHKRIHKRNRVSSKSKQATD